MFQNEPKSIDMQACSDPRGLLLLHGADKILTEFPEAFLMENVSDLGKRHRGVLDEWVNTVREGGYAPCR